MSNSTNQRNNNTLDQLIDRFLLWVDQRVEYARNNPAQMMYWCLGLVFMTVLLIPAMWAGVSWMDDLFTPNPTWALPDMLFEALVIAVVFVFGAGLLLGLTTRERSLAYLIVFISFCLIVGAASTLGIVSNRCLIDLQCKVDKFAASLSIVSVMILAGYTLLRIVRRTSPVYGVTFLAVAIWQSDLWMWHSLRKIGIHPNGDTGRGLFLLIFTILCLMFLFATGMPQPKPPEPKTKPRPTYPRY